MKRTMVATMVAAGFFAAGAQAQTAAGLPSGRAIMERSLRATGADTIMPKHTSMKMTGTLSLPAQGVSAPLENSRSSAGAFHVVITIDGFGEIEQGYADSTAYSINPQSGATILTGATAQSARRQAVWMDSPDYYTSMTTDALEKFQGKDAYKVSMVTKDGMKLTRWFDPTSGLAVATSSVVQGPDGTEQSVLTVVSDYKNFGGLLFPMKQIQQVGDNEQDILLEKIEFDNVPATVFALPAAIKALKK